jgi:hypothetical protein
MKLRSGFSYKSDIIYIKKINKNLVIGKNLEEFKKSSDIITQSSCLICMEPYKKGDKITSCNKSNLYKHNFHSTCLKEHIKCSAQMSGNAIGPFNCPYCMNKLNKFEIAVRRM